jgi:ABC-2 type transport system ATP-binding protein
MVTVCMKKVNKYIHGRHVLVDIDLELESHSIHGFFGPNGSGKTMLFRCLTGLIRATSGEIRVRDGQIGKDFSFPPDTGIIIENVGLWPQYTGFENLKILASIRNRISDREIREALLAVGLSAEDKRTYRKYSLGMKQRLGIAQAIMEHPSLLVLDEPTNSLDDEGVEMLHGILSRQREKGATILISSHSKEDINRLSDFRYSMAEGECTVHTGEWK